MRSTTIAGVLAVVLACSAAALVAGDNIIPTAAGPVEGYTSGTVQIFRGIPFAAPPTGDFRLKAPQPVEPWTAPKPCIVQQNICPQLQVVTGLYLGNEDCLYLDVYVPLNNGNQPQNLPVMVWLFGGGYILGDGWEFGFYDGQNFVEKYNVILVAPNYRLASLGFLALDQLRKEDPNNSTGNYALQDQTAALQWVQTNIANFGGDASQVTIFGESAGAFSVCWHLGSPASSGLFRAAIMESGGCDNPQFFRDYNDAREFSEEIAFQLGCDPISDQLPACLRALSTSAIMGSVLAKQQQVLGAINSSEPVTWGQLTDWWPALYPVMPWGPAIDGTSVGLPDAPLNSMLKGNWNNVPVLFGHNHDEGSVFEYSMYALVSGLIWPPDEFDLNASLYHFYGNQTIVDWIIDQYPVEQYNNSWDKVIQAVMRDDFFVCPTRRALKAVSNAGQDAYNYHWWYAGDFIESPFFGNYHSGEIVFVFSNEWPPLIHTFSERDRLLSDSFGTYWTNFAKYLNPNGNGTATQPNWPTFNSDTLYTQIMDVPPRTTSNLMASNCAMFDRVAQATQNWN